MFKRHFFLIAAACLFALMILAAVLRVAFAGGDEGGAPGGRRPAQQVSVISVQPRSFTDRVEVLGVARGARSVNITSSTAELITRVMFTDGQRVAAGAPLVELQAREEDAEIINAQAQVNQARREAERYRTLADRGVAPRVTAEQAETSLETAQASLAAARARRGDRVLRAPFAGILGLTTVTPGTLVSPGGVITTLDDISSIRVDFPLPERYLGRLSSGTPITATADAFGNETFLGRIALIDTRVNEQTRAATARAELANPGGRIRPGMMMRVVASQGSRSALAVPEAAIQYEGSGAFVYRLGAADGGTTAQRVEVEAGVVEGGFVEILSGLEAGDRLVGSGLNRIQPGAPVTPAAPRTAQPAQGAGARP